MNLLQQIQVFVSEQLSGGREGQYKHNSIAKPSSLVPSPFLLCACVREGRKGLVNVIGSEKMKSTEVQTLGELSMHGSAN